jgi:serine/threonine protein kinase
MSVHTPCPDHQRLEGLLRDNLPQGEQSALAEHVGDCTACQRELDRLASGPSAEALRQAERDRPPADSAYWAAVRELNADVTQPGSGERPRPPEVPLEFLARSDDPAHLGRLDHFAILGVVGRGGMGVVLRGFDTHLERDVAVKVLDPMLAHDETARRRFCRESRTAASISHENVVTVHHVAREESTDLPYLVMQLIDGEALDERLARVGRLPLKDVVRIGAQVAAGLAAAHEKGLIHRDVKPANVLLERGTDRVKLTDFGLARAAADVRLTRTGLVTGTPLYMAPEQARGEEIDARADLFSLGVLLYELCTGRTPFDARSPLAVLKRLTDERHQPVRALNSDIPEWLAAVIDRLLAKSPADRFQSAREVADLLDFQWSAMRTTSDVVAACPQKRTHRLRQVLVILAAVVAGALATAAAAVLLWPGRGNNGGTRDEPADPPLAVLRGGSGTIWGVSFSPGDRTLAMAIEDGTVKLWDLETKTVTATLAGHQAGAWTAAFSRDGSLLATASDDNSARIWDLATNQAVKTLPTAAAARAALFDRGAQEIFTGDRQGHIRVWNVATGTEVRAWQHPGAVYALALAPDGKTVASAGTDRVVRLWDTRTGQERLSLRGHEGPVYGLAFRPDGKVLASAGWDRSIRLWDPGTGDPLRTLAGHGRDIWSVDFAPDGRSLASAGQDGRVHVWDAESGRPLAAFRGHDGTVHCVVFSRDGSRIASGGRDGTVQLWPAAQPPQ